MKTIYETVGTHTSKDLSLEKAYEGNQIEYFSDCPTPTHENITGMMFDDVDDKSYNNRC